MQHSTTKHYQLKREIFHFAEKISAGANRDWQKFTADMTYGILASGSCVLSRIADPLQESIQKKNTIWRLSRKLTENMPSLINDNYLKMTRHAAGEGAPIFVDDSDVTKPYGQSFEALGVVRDGSSSDKRLEKGYYVTEAVTLTQQTLQPVSLFSQVHSSREKDYVSANDITFKALDAYVRRGSLACLVSLDSFICLHPPLAAADSVPQSPGSFRLVPPASSVLAFLRSQALT